ncbi:MAG: hypothetical protein ABID54_06805 [Pseudomonadota bacterium]
MKYIVPSSKIVFIDFMILLVSVLLGLNSVMSFSEERKETTLPPLPLPAISEIKGTGATAPNRAFITIYPGENGKRYFYNNKEVALWQLINLLEKAGTPVVVLRGDRKTIFEWEEFCQLTSKLMRAGVKEISYATTKHGGTKP